MASVELDFSELSEFNASMLKMVEKDMPNEAKKLMQRAGNALRRDMRTAYKQKTKRKTGNLLRGLSRGRAYIYQGTEYQVRVKNTAPHAHLIEYGHKAIGHAPRKRFNGKYVKGRHIAGKAAKNFNSKFADMADKFVDDLLERGIG